MKQTFRVFAALAAALFVGVSAFAQVTTSNIAGRVSDAQGPLAGIPVVATYTPTGNIYYAVSDKNGSYRINGVTAGGPYTLSVESLGYAKLEKTQVYAPLAETVEIDLTLSEESVVLAEAAVVADANESGMNIRRSGAGTSISAHTMENIPSVGRSLNDVMALTPQGSSTTSGFAVGGGSYRGSNVTVDGAAFNNAFGIGQNIPAGGTPISLDAIEQMSVNITPFDVRQSGFQGGAINAVTKSGTNQFHASVYNYYNSDALQGKKVGDASLTSTSLNNTLGVTVGGPIVKNKLFFFLNAEYTWDEVPGSTDQARVLGTEEWGSDKTYNRPTVEQMNTMSQFVQDKYGYNPGRYQDYALKTPDWKILGRLDWNINDNNKLNVRFSYTHTSGSNPPSSSMSPIGGTDSAFYLFNTPTTPVDPLDPSKGYVKEISYNRYSAGRQSAYCMPFESARYFQEQNFLSLSAELNSRVCDGAGNNMVRVTWSHQDEPRSYVGSLFPTVDILSNADVASPDTYANLTTIGVDPFTYGNLRDVHTVTVTDEFSYHKGINNITAGAQFEWNSVKNGYMQGGAGWYIFDSWDSFAQGKNPSAFMITHANLDDPNQQVFPTFNYSQVSVYAQDELDITDNFKLTAGIRLEMPIVTIPTDNENKDFTRIGEENPNSSFAGLKTSNLPKLTVNVSPRVGFNWDILKNRKLILRGGTGLFTGRIPNVWLVSAVGNSNCLQYQYIANAKTGAAVVPFSNDRTTIINSIYAGEAFKKQDLAAPTSATILDKNLKMPTSWKSSLAIDGTLPGGVKLSLEGVYSKNYNEVYATSLGYKQEGTIQLPGEPAPRNLWVAEGIKNKDGSKVNGYYMKNVNDKNLQGSYYSITASVSKSFNFGLDLMAAYTRSGAKSLSDGNGDQISEFANTYCLNGCNEPVLGNAYYVSPNRVIANIGYNINEGKRTATHLGVFYEGYNIGFISSYSYSRVSYLMDNVSGAGSASQLIYIPTTAELATMEFHDPANRQAFEDFITKDKYLSKHRGQYSERNGVTAPWLGRVNFHVAQDIYFYVAGRKETLQIALDIKNVGNLLNSNWGVYKQMSSNKILKYGHDEEKGQTTDKYTFTEPTWKPYNNLASTWQMLLSARIFF